MTGPGGLSATGDAILTRGECQELARHVLGMVSGSQAQVKIQSDVRSGIQFARGDIHMASETAGAFVRLEVEVEDRHASGSTSRLDGDSLRSLVNDVEALARENRTRREWTAEDVPSILPPQDYLDGPQIFFPATLEAMTGDIHAEIFRRSADAAEAEGLIAAGDVSCSASARAILNTKGQWAYEQSSYGQFSLTTRTSDGTGSGWAWSGYEDWDRVDIDRVISDAIALAVRSASPVAIEPGRYTLILEPAAVAELIHPIIGLPTSYWSAPAADAGDTVFSNDPIGTNKIGLQMMDRRLGMVSDPSDPERPASTIGDAWRPLVPVPWFREGVLEHLATPPRYARQKESDPVFNPGGVRLTAGGPSQTLEEMIADTRRGVWVHRLSHVAVMDRQTLLLTGTTRDGTFLIENGEITRPIKNFRFTESPFFVFNRPEAWGDPVRASELVVAPRLKVRDFNFTSLSDAV